MGGRQMSIPLGRALGGWSAVDALIFTPPPKANIGAWAGI